VLNTTQPASKCVTGNVMAIFDKYATTGSEDCLYLNVFVPAAALASGAAEKLPVLQWIYGGGWIAGDAWKGGKYDGTHLAKLNNAIVVAGNYRLGVFGFAALPALQGESPALTTGNYGLQDQTAAMQWTHDNIAAFGGDAARVAIFGQSAGGFSVCFHLVSPASRGLFSSAIMQSGSCDSPTFFRTLHTAVTWTSSFAALAGCPVSGDGTSAAACLRSKTTAELQNVQWQPRGSGSGALPYFPNLYPIMPWGATMDGAKGGLAATPLILMEDGIWNNVPVILGTMRNDGSLFAALLPIVAPNNGKAFPLPPTAVDVRAGMAQLIGTGAHSGVNASFSAAMELFINQATGPGRLYELSEAASWENFNLTGRLITDFFFACGTRRAARAISQGGQKVFLYQFDAPVPADAVFDLLGDYHALDVGIVFGTEHVDNTTDFLSQAMGAWWGGMAHGNSPNAQVAGGLRNTTLPVWPAYDWNGTRSNMKLLQQPALQDNMLGPQCDFWDTHFNLANQPVYPPSASGARL
jgi:para-nitrobenzyl esterase